MFCVGEAAYSRAISPANQVKQPLLYLPPPPQHPPPSAGSQPGPQRCLSTDNDDDIYSRIPASSSDGGGDHYNYAPSLPLVDYYDNDNQVVQRTMRIKLILRAKQQNTLSVVDDILRKFGRNFLHNTFSQCFYFDKIALSFSLLCFIL